METQSTSDERAAIRDAVRRINVAWQQGRFEELGGYFHPRMTIAIPWSGVRCEGRERCVQSYIDFMGAAKITQYSESDPVVDVCGDTAVAVFEWDMEWTVAKGSQRETGYDVLVFTREVGKWQVVWRSQVSRPAKA